jgi:hypothetical protein
VAGEGEAFAGVQLCRVADPGGGFCIVAEAVSQVAGKILSVLLVLEASRIIEDFVLSALAVEVCGLVAEVAGPAGVLKCNPGFPRRGTNLRPVAKLTDAFRGDFAACVRVKGQGAQRGDACHIITEHQLLLCSGRRAPVKIENAFFGPQSGEKGEVAFAILYAEFTRRMRFIKGRGPVGDAVFIKQGGGDGLDILLLKDAEILAQSARQSGAKWSGGNSSASRCSRQAPRR